MLLKLRWTLKSFNNGKVELQNQKNALVLYSNQYDRLMNEASLNKEEAQEILDEFNNLIEKEDKKLNQDALQYIKALKELAEKSNKLFIDQDEVRSILQDMSKTVLKIHIAIQTILVMFIIKLKIQN